MDIEDLTPIKTWQSYYPSPTIISETYSDRKHHKTVHPNVKKIFNNRF